MSYAKNGNFLITVNKPGKHCGLIINTDDRK